MIIQTQLLPISLRRSGKKNDGIKYLVCHDTGGPNATAQNEVDYYTKSAFEMEASAHYFVDDLGAIMCIPENECAWHVRYSAGIAPNVKGSFANDVALGIELCYFPSNIPRSKAAYENYTTLIASLCKRYVLEPSRDLVGHYKLDPSRRTDPINAFRYIGKTWEQFVLDVQIKLDPPTPLSADKFSILMNLLRSWLKK